MTGDAWDKAQDEIARLRAEVAALRELKFTLDVMLVGRAEKAEAEVAALRETVEKLEQDGPGWMQEEVAALREANVGLHDLLVAAERDLAEARALLARATAQLETVDAQIDIPGDSLLPASVCKAVERLVPELRAFLRRDEAGWCGCLDRDGGRALGEHRCARDEARRCTCGGGRYEPVGQDHAPDCPARVGGRDESLRLP